MINKVAVGSVDNARNSCHSIAHNICVKHNFISVNEFDFRQLCEEEELDLNVRDKWDSTPL